MAYTLNGTEIRRPNSMDEDNSTQVVQQRTLNGQVSRDYFGRNKRVWRLEFAVVTKADYDIINAIYTAYLSTGDPVEFISTEGSYPVAATDVHVDLLRRSFNRRGDGYLSDFTLILTEA